MKPVTIFFEASKQAGLGHLSRVRKLGLDLKSMGIEVGYAFEADGYARKMIESHGIKATKLSDIESSVAIVDALRLPERLEETFALHKVRAIISPKYNRPELATHVFVSSLSQELTAGIRAGCEISVSPSYLFSQCYEVAPKPQDFGRLEVGFYLPQAGAYFDLELMLSEVISLPTLDSLRFLGDPDLLDEIALHPKFTHSGITINAWDFFDSVNVLIAGDGLIVGEAVYRGIPVISLGLQENSFKQQSLAESGSVLRFDLQDPLLVHSVTSALRDEAKLLQAHTNAKEVAASVEPSYLAKQIALLTEK